MAWLKAKGFTDAHSTSRGGDGGVDVASKKLVAQVKAEMKPTGRPAVQQLAGVAAYENKTALFFALSGFTAEAYEWASGAGVLLFEFDLQGEPEPVTKEAEAFVRAAIAPSG